MADLSYIQRADEVKITGQDSTGTTVNYVGADANGNLLVKDYADGSTGAAVPTVTTQIGGSDGTNLRTLSTDTSGKLKVDVNDGSGTAITSDTPGTSGSQRLHVATPDITTASTALGALNATISTTITGMASVGFQLAAGTLIGTITPQCSIDGGTSWVNCAFFNPTTSSVSSSVVFGSSNTLTILSILPIGGSSNVRVIVTAYTSGTANAILRASQITGAAGAIASAAFGTVTNTSVTVTTTAALLLAANPNRKYVYISNPTAGSILIQFGTITGLSSTVGLYINKQGFYEIKGDNLYTGPIYAIASGGSSIIAVAEGTP